MVFGKAVRLLNLVIFGLNLFCFQGNQIPIKGKNWAKVNSVLLNWVLVLNYRRKAGQKLKNPKRVALAKFYPHFAPEKPVAF